MKGRYSWQDEMLSRLKNIDGKLKKMSDTCTIAVRNTGYEKTEALYSDLLRLQKLALSVIQAIQKDMGLLKDDGSSEEKIIEGWSDMGKIKNKQRDKVLCMELPPLYGKGTTQIDIMKSVARAVALQYAFSNGKKIIYDDCVVIFRHLYEKESFFRDKVDHDNILIRPVLNILSDFFLADDEPETCDIFQCFSYADCAATQVFLVPRSKFIEWLEMHEYGEDSTKLC